MALTQNLTSNLKFFAEETLVFGDSHFFFHIVLSNKSELLEVGDGLDIVTLG